MAGGAPVELRRCVLAASVLYDVDLVPSTAYVTLTGAPEVRVPWAECAAVVAGLDLESPATTRALSRWLLCRRWVADHTSADLAARARPVGLPVGHAVHPGADWVRQATLGGALHLGLGFRGLDPRRPDDVVVVAEPVLRAAGADPAPWWPAAQDYLETMGAMAVSRWRRDPAAPLRPMGDCDVVTLLGSAVFRRALTAHELGGVRAVAVPLRTRGWLDLGRTDPAFAPAAAALAEPEERGFDRPLLVTADEVTMAPAGGRPAEIVLRDPAAGRPWHAGLRYR